MGVVLTSVMRDVYVEYEANKLLVCINYLIQSVYFGNELLTRGNNSRENEKIKNNQLKNNQQLSIIFIIYHKWPLNKEVDFSSSVTTSDH